jgi:uncharacterized membrane protein (DUF485 family)
MSEVRAGSDGTGGPQQHPEIDWQAVERSPEFRELVSRRNRFVIPATVFFLAWFFGFIVLAGYAPDFMGEEFITDGLTVGYALALSQFAMVWILGYWYLHKADTEFDPLAEKARTRARESALAGDGHRAGRFERQPAGTAERTGEGARR